MTARADKMSIFCSDICVFIDKDKHESDNNNSL